MTEPEERFADLIADVKPLRTPAAADGFGRTPKIRQTLRIAAQNHRAPPEQQPAGHNADGITALQLQHMREIRVPLAREIDLHGYYVDDALRLLADFLNERRNRRPEYWLIVHGKGKNSPHYDIAPLKTAILDSLHSHPAVGALVSATDSRGESGAAVVRIRPRDCR